VQLLDLGVRLFSRHSLHEVTVDLLAETAGISRGLIYHYFGGIVGFQEAVVRRAADELIERTAPPPDGDPLTRLQASLAAYVGFVEDTYEGYLSLVRGASAGNATMAAIYEEARGALTDRILVEGGGELVPASPAARLVVRGWQAMAEEMVLTWRAGTEAHPVSREELVELLAASLFAVVSALPAGEGSPIVGGASQPLRGQGTR